MLSTICLVGSWNARNQTDQAIVAEIAGRDYSTVEADLLALAAVDDPPVLRIGSAWNAKAPLELLHLWGGRLTAEEIDRFLCCLRRVLQSADPVLDLEEDKRWMAAVYGKVRQESGALINSILDSLTKLAVRGAEVSALQHLHLNARIARLVSDVLDNGDRTRWLSVSGFLSELAEAAPDAFLHAVEAGLRRPDSPVMAMIAETAAAGSGITGRCWHADLLWSLERLAWAPQRLGRMADILAQLARAPKPGNWGNTPLNSLRSLFLSWWPQTTAPLTARLNVLDRVVCDHRKVGWDLLTELGLRSRDFASPNAAPAWRDDDAGAVGRADDDERRQTIRHTIRHVHDRLIGLAPGDAVRVAQLVESVDQLHPDDQKRVWELAEEFCGGRHNDEEREALCEKLRGLLHWHLNYNKHSSEEVERFLERPNNLYRRLQPDDLVLRHRWLFNSHWPQLPERHGLEASNQRLSDLRHEALSELFAASEWEGVMRLVQSCGEPWVVGITLGCLELPDDSLAVWVMERLSFCAAGQPERLTVSGLLHSLDDERRRPIADHLLSRLTEPMRSDEEVLALVQALPFGAETWARVDDLGERVARRYWETTPARWCRNHEEAVAACERLLAIGRPCAAFQVLRGSSKETPTPLLLRVLSAALQTTEPVEVIQGLDHYSVCESLKRLAADPSMDEDEVIRLEVGFWPLFSHFDDGNQRIHRKLARDPEFFVELLRLVYRSEHVDEPDSPRNPQLSQIAYDVLDEWRRVPGSRDDGSVDEPEFNAWVEQALAISADLGRRQIAQTVIGKMLAHAPSGTDGLWPCAAVRDVLDHPEHDALRNGLRCGLFNKRGMTSRALDEGGGQERALAARYRGWADGLAASHWRLAGVLSALADEYDRHAQTEDANAAWNCER